MHDILYSLIVYLLKKDKKKLFLEQLKVATLRKKEILLMISEAATSAFENQLSTVKCYPGETVAKIVIQLFL